MRTLDEVIAEIRDQMGLGDPVLYDALHYLKEYKNTGEYYKEAIGHVTEVIDHYEKMVADYLSVNNPPLSWEELRSMEGKPIWMEVDYHNPEETYKYWTIVKYFDSNEGGDMVFTGTGFYYKDLLGIDWRAYRKEKNETD